MFYCECIKLLFKSMKLVFKFLLTPKQFYYSVMSSLILHAKDRFAEEQQGICVRIYAWFKY